MDAQFNTNVYNFTRELMNMLLEKFNGKVVGSDDMNMEDIMKFCFDNNENCIDGDLQCTSESQGHGKAWEVDIQKRVYGIPLEIINGYSHTSKYDIPAKDNILHKKNVSIKTSGDMNLCMSDVRKFLNSENMDVVCIIWRQITPKKKQAMKTVVFDFDDFKKTLIEDLSKYNYTLEGWLKDIDDYGNYVKNLPKDYYIESKNKLRSQKEHIIKKTELCKNINYFQVNPKIDSKQQRVQCSINLNKIDIEKTITDGGMLFDKEYTKQIHSSSRKRHKK
jgi:hypothetical protein